MGKIIRSLKYDIFHLEEGLVMSLLGSGRFRFWDFDLSRVHDIFWFASVAFSLIKLIKLLPLTFLHDKLHVRML